MSSRICMSEVSMLVHSDLTPKLSSTNGITLIFWILLFIVLVLWAILLLWRGILCCLVGDDDFDPTEK